MGLEYTPYTPYKRYKLEISYDGSDYCGWQIQPHSPSVQQTLQETLEKLYKHPIHLIGSSRTDTGVHALGFVASFITPVQPDIPAENLMKVLNRRLPYSIRIRSAVEVPLEHVQLEIALGSSHADGHVVTHDLNGNHRHSLTLGGVDLAGHDRGAGLVFGNTDLAKTKARAGSEPTYVVCDLHHIAGKRLNGAVCKHQLVL